MLLAKQQMAGLALRDAAHSLEWPREGTDRTMTTLNTTRNDNLAETASGSRLLRTATAMLLGGLVMVSTGCRDRTGCGDALVAVSSKANLAVRDQDPEALRAAAAEASELVRGSEVETMKGVPRRLETVAAALEKAQAAEGRQKDEAMASYRAKVKGMDASFDAALAWCE